CVGLGFGLAGLMCSAVGVVMVAVVGLAALWRRGRRIALLHVIPLAACYAAWFVAFGRTDSGARRFSAADVVRFLGTGLVRAFAVVGPVAVFGYLAALVLAGGLTVAFLDRPRSRRQEDRAAALALAIGACAVLAVTAVNRASFGAGWARQSRYVSLVVAMILPALAVATEALVRRWRAALPFAVAFFLAGI